VEDRALGRSQQRWRDRVIEDDSASDRRRRDETQRRHHRLRRQIRGYAKPRKERAFIGVIARGQQSISQCLRFKVDRREREIIRDRDTGLLKARSLPGLRRRVVDFEYAQSAFRKLVSVGKRVKPGAQNDILGYSALNAERELILGVSTARSHESSQVRR